MPKEVKRQNQTGVYPPTEAVEVVTSQGTPAGVVIVVRSVEEERNVTIVSLVVALVMWLVSVLEVGIGVVVRETTNDYSCCQW